MKLFNYGFSILWCALLTAEALADGTAGIGVALGTDNGRIVVKQVLPDSPAARSRKIHVNDQIISIAQGSGAPVSVISMPLVKVVAMTRGDSGSEVRVTVLPGGNSSGEPREVQLIRKPLPALNPNRAANAQAPAAYDRGHVAPEISGADAEGKSFKLSEYRGKVVLIDFWGDW